ncbi:MAG TPA: right-handed parallel beta-helix repeat-containing protein [Thermoanaerobaculia bacterium]|nr:right-handed parallel beta-helix repeat-containing protein [Thermoanaerobaculia bacterium]
MNRNAFATWLLLFFLAPLRLYGAPKVDCSKGDSINSELAKLSKTGPNVLTVSGSCAEDVVIEGFDDLTLVAAPGASLNPASASSKSVLLVNSSRRVTVEGFAINIPAPAPGSPVPWVAEFNGSFGCVLKNLSVTGGGGIRLQRTSYVSITDSTLHDVLIAIIVGNACNADIRGVTIDNTLAPAPRGQIGIAVFEGSTAFAEGVTISGFNQGVLTGGTFAVLGPGFFDATRPVVIQGNRTGIAVNSGGLASLSGPITISGNGQLNNDLTGGVVVNHGTLAVTGALPQTGLTQIDNNMTQGVLIMNSGSAQITGPVSISHNGYNGVVAVTKGIVGFGGIGNPFTFPTVTLNTARDIFCDSRSLVTGSNNVTGAAHRECADQIPGMVPFIPRTPAP